MKLSIMFVIIALPIMIVGIDWVKNLIALSNCDFESPYRCEIVHGVDIIPPVGVITGWIDVGT